MVSVPFEPSAAHRSIPVFRSAADWTLWSLETGMGWLMRSDLQSGLFGPVQG
jgi:hypothetical protein